MTQKEWTLSQIIQFDEIIDVRTPQEYQQDHILNAVNFPVLDDEQRVYIGTLHKQVSAFEARKQGAILVAQNIAKHIKDNLSTRPRSWKPLIYCWRGGMRSQSMTTIFNSIGWRAEQLPGGYKAFRQCVIATLKELVPQLKFCVLCGSTGVGKSRLLEALSKKGTQVLNLEEIANHRGSVFGESMQGNQPSQKSFENTVCSMLHAFDPSQLIYVESESRRIGNIQIPAPLIEAMRSSQCIKVEATLEQRAEFLINEYHHFIDQPDFFRNTLVRLKPYIGENKVNEWYERFSQGHIKQVVMDLLVQYYDPFYKRSINKHFADYQNTSPIQIQYMNNAGFEQSADMIIKSNSQYLSQANIKLPN